MVPGQNTVAPASSDSSSDPPARVDVALAVHQVVRCKWSLQILAQVRNGVHRPGAIRRACRGLSTKVMNERLTRMLRLGILERVAYPEIPPRVEYRLSRFGRRFLTILNAIDRLQSAVDESGPEADVHRRR